MYTISIVYIHSSKQSSSGSRMMGGGGLSHVMHINESHHSYEWVTSHIWMCCFTPFEKAALWAANTAAATAARWEKGVWIKSHVCVSYIAHLNESRHTYECAAVRRCFLWGSSTESSSGSISIIGGGGNESRHSHTWITHVTCASRHTMNVLLCTSSTASEEAGLRAAAATAEWREGGVRVTTRIWMTHVTCTNESRLTYAAMYIITCL
jgi:hypothetical protein